MATRNPSAPTEFPDEESLLAQEIIVTTVPDNVFDLIEYILDAGQLVLMDVFALVMTTSGTAVTARQYHLYTKDFADADSPATYASHSIYVRAWCDSSTTAAARVTGGNGTASQTITATTPTWVKFSSSYDIATHDTQVDLTLQFNRASGAGQCYIDAWMVVAEEE